jgi:hypothetical protein
MQVSEDIRQDALLGVVLLLLIKNRRSNKKPLKHESFFSE